MPELTLDQALQQAIACHLNGQLEAAELLYRAVLQVQPDHPDASRNLHVLLSEQIVARQQEAESLYRSIQESLLGQPDTAQSSSAPILQSDQEAQSDTLPKPEQPPPRPLEAAANARQTSPAPPSRAEDKHKHQKASRKKKKKDRSVRSQGTATQAQRRALIALYEAGRIDDCEKNARQLTRTYPNDGFCWKVYGTVLAQNGKTEQALPSLERALALTPRDADIHNSLGVVYDSLQRLEDALTHYRQALELAPNNAQIHNNLGTTLKALGRLSESEASYHRALEFQPDYAETHSNLGNVLRDLGRQEEAEVSLRQALALDPNFARAHRNLGALLLDMGRVTEAEGCCRRALELEPNAAQGHSHLGSALKELGRLDEALDCYSQALTIKPDHATAFDNLLFTLNYHPDKSAEEIFSAYQEYDRRFGLPHRAAWRTHTNDRSLSRRLRIGYVSPDFKRHSTRHFLEPLLAHHDKQTVEVTAYAELYREDDFTRCYKKHVDHWVTTTGMSDLELAERIRADGVDILVDLAGHTAGNRLGVFARKPAPVSVSWLGYGYTTGLSAIDYFLADDIIVPVGSEALFAEAPWRIPSLSTVYRPAEDMGDPGPLPLAHNGHVTFGTLTRPVRINYRLVRTWSAILHQVPNARLIIDSKDLADPIAKYTLAERFHEHGIEAGRLEMTYHSPPWDRLRAMDIGLDCFPHNSGTTLCEHAYLGVPFISLAGRPSVGRMGAALLNALGLPELVARNEEEYIQKTVALATDPVTLAALRERLRNRMRTSCVTDEKGFAHRVEHAYRSMWLKWCRSNSTSGSEIEDAPAMPNRSFPPSVVRPDFSESTHPSDSPTDFPHQPAATGPISPFSGQTGHIRSELHRQDCIPSHAKPTDRLEALQTLIHLFEAGQFNECEAATRDLLQNHPQDPFGWKLHGSVLAQLKRSADALPTLQKALELNPGDPEIHNAIGIVLRHLGHLDDSLEYYHQALKIRPNYAEAHNNLGTTLKELHRIPESITSYRRAIAIKPAYAQAHTNLGNSLKDLGNLEEAVACHRHALKLRPKYADAFSNLGAALKDLHRLPEAEKSCREAIALQPDLTEAHNNLATVLKELGRLEEAEAYCRSALALQPDLVDTHANLGNVLKDLGRLDEALHCYSRALEIRPDCALAFHNRLFTLNYHPDKSAEEIFAAYREYDRQFGLPHRAAWRPHTNDRNPERRLRIGYVSPDLRCHSTRHFLQPLMAHHDRRVVELTAYAELKYEDVCTQSYKSLVDHWVPTYGLSDVELAERIRADRIDILVDLAGHTDSSRLAVFAYKPTPVSISWLGYGYTTGLTAIDYFLANASLVPPGSEGLFSETPWRLDGPNGTYRPAEGMGEPGCVPALDNGYVTFGTLTRSVRINHRTIRAWSSILQQVKDARLIIDSCNFADTHTCDRLRARFAEHGIGAERLLLGFHTPPWNQLRAIDIGLDCFPHNSGTTLLEHLYLGMPIVTLASRPSVGRLGAMLLDYLGHPEWIAKSETEYVDIAVALADDLDALTHYRACLREEMKASALMDEVGFVRRLENAYREMWRDWCASGPN